MVVIEGFVNDKKFHTQSLGLFNDLRRSHKANTHVADVGTGIAGFYRIAGLFAGQHALRFNFIDQILNNHVLLPENTYDSNEHDNDQEYIQHHCVERNSQNTAEYSRGGTGGHSGQYQFSVVSGRLNY